MSDTANNSVLQLRALHSDSVGQTQESRSLVALGDHYFLTEERGIQAWLGYIQSFCQHLAFVDAQNPSSSGSWQGAIPTLEQAKALERWFLAGAEAGTLEPSLRTEAERPDKALLLAFLNIMKVPQQQFSEFTHRHQQHYYRSILRFTEKPVVLDKAHVLVHLGDKVASKTLFKGTLFNGGEDSNGKPLLYQSLNHTVLNQSKVSRVLTLSQRPQVGAAHEPTHSRLLLTEGFNRQVGIDLSENGLLTFGEADEVEGLVQTHPDLGFTLASPELYLASGERTITLTWTLKDGSSWPMPNSLSSYFNVSISTQDGLVLVDLKQDGSMSSGTIVATISLDGLFPEIAPLADAAQVNMPNLPFLSFVLKADQHNNTDLLSGAYFSEVGLGIQVRGASGVVANHDLGTLDTSQPFEPFTHEPQIASKFNFIHPELLIKNITSAEVNCFWLGRPAVVGEYYQSYADYRGELSAATTPYIWNRNKVKVAYSGVLLKSTENNLFGDAAPQENIATNAIPIIVTDADFPNAQLNYQDLPVSNDKATEWPRWFSFTLSGNDFGYSDFAQVVHYGASQVPPVSVNPPYIPSLNQVLINYTSMVHLSLTDQSLKSRHPLNHIHPIGRPSVSASNSRSISLLPSLRKWGYLYIGVSRVPLPGQFRLYFQLDPVDGSNISNTPNLEWSYLDGAWKTFSRSQGGRLEKRARIIEDSTYDLLDSGVVAFELPKLDLATNFVGDELFWIRVSIDDSEAQASAGEPNVAQYSRIRNVFTQGLEVELLEGSYHPNHFLQPLPAESIAGLQQPDPDVSEVLQPYVSFAGKAAEKSAAVALRASERIRHKQRALTQWDYEHLLLAQFPELYLVRCYRNSAKNRVDIVVVPINHDRSILQPKVPLYLKRRIQRFVGIISPPGIDVFIEDPNYKAVTFDVTVKISEGFDIDSAVSELNQLLTDILTPWNQGAAVNSKAVSKTVYLSDVANTLEMHPAVAVIYVLRAEVDNKQYLQKIVPASDREILVPVADHKISLLNKTVEVFEGIGKWRIDNDFVIP